LAAVEVLGAGLVVAGAAAVVGNGVVVAAAGLAGVPLPGVMAVAMGLAVAAVVSAVFVLSAAPLAETGRVVTGVGSGGSGFDRILAINSFRPTSDLLRYLYQVVRDSIHTFLFA
jgi:hypothetical protein